MGTKTKPITKIMYKVVRNVKGKLISCVVDAPSIQVQYRKGRWARPKLAGSKLFVFEGRRRALNWSVEGQEVWAVEAVNAEPCIGYAVAVHCCDAVKLIKRIA